MAEPAYHLYVLLCDEHILYTGIAIEPKARLQQHLAGHPYGAKFTRRFKKLNLMYQVEIGDRATAQSVEWAFKKLPRVDKLNVIDAQLDYTRLSQYLSKTNK